MVRNEADFLRVVDAVGDRRLSQNHRALLERLRAEPSLQVLFGGRGQAHAIYKVFPRDRRDVWFLMVYENGDVFAETESLLKGGYLETEAIYRRMLRLEKQYGRVGSHADPRGDLVDLLAIAAAGVHARAPEAIGD
ncbi:MAG: hypothetical protein GY715_14770 [Planctomycetes bacterium]|nr:hypothetical protein [Planctomycetota bacterium]